MLTRITMIEIVTFVIYSKNNFNDYYDCRMNKIREKKFAEKNKKMTGKIQISLDWP